MASCERPVWTCCFVLLWILLVPGAFLTHISVSRLSPHVKELPNSIARGFDEVLKFASLEKDSKNVETSAAAALSKCGVNASLVCPKNNYPHTPTFVDINTTEEKARIRASFQGSLDVVNKVAHDKFFGVDDLSSTAKKLDEIVKEIERINNTMPCGQAVPTFCAIYEASGGIISGMSQVNKALDAFKTNDIVEEWDNNHRFFMLLHALPYFMVVALLCFTCFWCKGGVCCCCRGGTKAGFVLIPYAIFWLASFTIYGVVFVTGILLTRFQDKVEVSFLKGKPNLEDTIAHIQTEYPEFWDLVFAKMVDGLSKLYASSVFFILASIVIAVYTSCECCCCPYRRKRAGEEAKPATSA